MLTIIGCGNPVRSDDGVGVFVARSLQAYLVERPRDHVRVFDAGTGGMEVMFQARGTRKLVIVDAARTGSEAGAIFQVPGSELASDHAPGYTLHDFRWDHALAAGKRIFREDFPTDVTVYLIEAARLDFGLELSEPVRLSAQKVIADLEQMIDEYAEA
ncbi:MAG: hydrogenase maturation protease [Azospira oryzae]|nr:MAG: hydrogenase maturation protease [Azospira oryzae]PZP78000.1 MAG: hydrogenase maturation protease [Azospira oryzae]